MQELCNALVESFQNVGMDASYDASTWLAKLTVAGVTFELSTNGKGTLTIDWYNKFRRLRSEDYNMADIMAFLIGRLPIKLAAKEKAETTQSKRAIADEFSVNFRDPRVTILYNVDEDKYHLVFRSEAIHIIGIAADKVLELSEERMPEQVEPAVVGPRMFDLIAEDDAVLSTKRLLDTAWALDEGNQELLERLTNLVPGEMMRVDSEYRVYRKQ